VERLASGLRINSSRDDAAGLAVRELIRADVAMFRQASKNAMDGINLLQTAEGALAASDEILIRMKELAEQASNDTYSTAQRTIMNDEFAELMSEVTRIANSTAYNEKKLLAAAGVTVNIHLGGTDKIAITSAAMTATGLGLTSVVAVKEVWTHSTYKASADNIYVAAVDITDTTDDLLDFLFSAGGDSTEVDIGGYASTGITLNELVAEINDPSSGANYAMADAYFDSTYNAYRLRITSSTAGDSTLTFSVAGAAISQLDGTAGNWIGDAASTDGSDSSGTATLNSATNAETALGVVTTAIGTKDSYRAQLGYWMNRLSAATTVLNIQSENLLAAESRISDVDVATEMAAMTRNQVLAQAGIAMLAQANSMPQMTLTLLR
jgi:flagellin